MTETIDAPLNEPAGGENLGQTGAAESLTNALEVLRGHAGRSDAWPQAAQQIKPALDAALGTLELESRIEMLPLMAEISLCARASGAAAKDLTAALTHGLELLLEQLHGGVRSNWPAAQIVAIADLRSARGQACVNALDDEGGNAAESTGITINNNAELSAGLARFRKSLLEFLRADGAAGAPALAQACRRLNALWLPAGGLDTWQRAAQIFEVTAASGAGHHVAIRRLAVRLEKLLRRSLEESANERPVPPPPAVLQRDLELLQRVLARAYSHSETADGFAPADIEVVRLEKVLEALRESPEVSGGLAATRDGFLIQARFNDWLKAWKLEQSAAGSDEILAASAAWADSAAAPSLDDTGSNLHQAADQLEQAGALLKRMDEAAAKMPTAAAEVLPAVSVDESLLEHLNLAAAEIRGARSTAEAKMGSFRGGLENMERTIKSLRSQLEALEVDSSASVVEGDPVRPPAGSMPETLGALSRGIEELAGLKDALQTLTEETESVLASQAGEDAELEQGLLRTRLVPVGGQFDTWSQWVDRVAAGWGVAASLNPRGGEVMLERGQAEALSRALKPMLEACVRDGLTGSASPARINPNSARLELLVSQPKFDVLVDLSYEGAPLGPTTLADLRSAFDAFGAVCGSRVDARGRTRFSVMVPGPPRPMDLLLVDIGDQRFGLPVEGVSGVCRPQRSEVSAGEPGQSLSFEDREYRLISLADVAGLARADLQASMCVLIVRGDERLACLVDTVVGRERLLVRSPGPLLCANPWVLGAVIGELAAPTLVLDLDAIRPPDSDSRG